jgi:hypothetical protein
MAGVDTTWHLISICQTLKVAGVAQSVTGDLVVGDVAFGIWKEDTSRISITIRATSSTTGRRRSNKFN